MHAHFITDIYIYVQLYNFLHICMFPSHLTACLPHIWSCRTDDEQLRELQQRSRNKVKQEHHPVDRTKSETRLNSRGDARWNKYKSWDNEKEGQRTFDTYKKLITPGFYGARRQMSKSHDELRYWNVKWYLLFLLLLLAVLMGWSQISSADCFGSM